MATRGCDLTDFQRGQIYALKFHANFSRPKIAECLEISENTVKKYLQRLSAGGDAKATNRASCGRRKSTTDEEDEEILSFSSDNPFCSARIIKQNLNLECTRRTVTNRLLSGGLKAFTPARKTALTVEHEHRRLEWATEKSSWSLTRWKKVVFSDESKFCFGQSRVQYVRRSIGDRYTDRYVCRIPNRSVAHVMVWGAFSSNGHTNLVRIQERLDTQKYIDILEGNLLPAWDTIAQAGAIFQQDNAPIHSANRTKLFLQHNGIPTLDWPAFSPDMNPIEHVWAQMELKLQREYEDPEDSDQLFATLDVIWNELMDDVNYRVSLITSMRDRVQAVLDAEGGFTRY